MLKSSGVKKTRLHVLFRLELDLHSKPNGESWPEVVSSLFGELKSCITLAAMRCVLRTLTAAPCEDKNFVEVMSEANGWRMFGGFWEGTPKKGKTSCQLKYYEHMKDNVGKAYGMISDWTD